MTATLAFLVDAYRELNARKLFWITLIISGIVVVGFGSIGFYEDGVSILFGLKQIPSPFIYEGSPWARALYMGIFSDFIVGLWLAWAATILALISTTTIFPDMMESGSIDLILSKPIGRIRLFITKFCMGLMFVILQVAIFCGGIFLCVGLRVDEWNWKIFLGVPLVTVFFSYLYSVNVLVAVLSRSALAALLLTFLLWFALFSINTTEALLKRFEIQTGIELAETEQELNVLRERLETVDQSNVIAVERIKRKLEDAEETHETRTGLHNHVSTWHNRADLALMPLPKTSWTIELLSKSLKDPEGFDMAGIFSGDMSDQPLSEARETERKATRAHVEYAESISTYYIIGSSLAFEAVMLLIAGFVFVRRDY